MEQETCVCASDKKKWGKGGGCAPSGAAYGLGLIGALVYFIQNAETFWMGAIGVLKALVWPAFIVYKLLEFLNF